MTPSSSCTCLPPPSLHLFQIGGRCKYYTDTHTHYNHMQTQCLSSPARHGHGDFDRLLVEHPPGYRIVCWSRSLSLSSLLLRSPLSHPLLSSCPSPLTHPLLLCHICFCPVTICSSSCLLQTAWTPLCVHQKLFQWLFTPHNEIVPRPQ